jgi:N-methylhydantoinase A/oxoprolinase/acetone carboxylase beta subunit
VTVRVAVALPATELPAEGPGEQPERGSRRAWFAGNQLETTVLSGPPDAALDGPLVVDLAEATVVVPPSWRCGTAADGTLEMTWTR